MRFSSVWRLVPLFCLCAPGFAAADQVKLYYDGNFADVRNAPILLNGRTLIHLRDAFQTLGAAVHYFSADRKIKAWRGETEITLWIDRPTAIVNGKEITLDQPPIFHKYPTGVSGTLVPLRFISQALDAGVKYTAKGNRVDIDTTVMGFYTEKAPFKVGDMVEFLVPHQDQWTPAKVTRVFDHPKEEDTYVIEYTDRSGRKLTPNMARRFIRKPRN